jgi:hypothetical protein
MGFQISPGVQFTEIDLTGIIPAVSTTDGAFAGPFLWGPVDHIKLISHENELADTFGKPSENADVAASFFSCANFLSYGDKLRVVRSADTSSHVERVFTIADIDTTNLQIEFEESLEATLEEPAVKRRDLISLAFLPNQENLVIGDVESSTTLEIHYSTPIPAGLQVGDTVVIKCYAGAANASADGKGALVKNDDHYALNYTDGQANVGAWVARFPGELGNSLAVSVCPSETAHQVQLAGTCSNRVTTQNGVDVDGGEWILGVGTEFTKHLIPGSVLVNTRNLEERTVVAITNNTNIKIDVPFDSPLNGDTVLARWQYATLFSAPTTTSAGSKLNALNDEINVVVVDANGSLTGVPGTILEKFKELSKASNAKLDDGTPLYYKEVINRKSKYIRWTDHPVFADQTIGANDAKWGDKLTPGKNFTKFTKPHESQLGGGEDALLSVKAQEARFDAYDLFADPDKIDVSLIIMGNAGAALTNHVIDNIAEKRLDCVVFCSPPLDAVKDNFGSEAEDIVDYRKNTLNANTSYAVMDSGWKVQFDKYNDKEVDVPLNADIAGLCVRTETTRDAWWSPAGYDRGRIKNIIKLYFSPDKTDRDELYKNSVNPVIDQPGEGRLLFGDKTLLAKASAFDRINVRRLFIVLEKAISKASKKLLFEFNDEFTRQTFRSMVEPFLRDVQSKRGIYDFRVVCDRTNNTPEIIDRNEFVGDIYIKPARSINFIQLNFIAVRTGVEFSEIVGKF